VHPPHFVNPAVPNSLLLLPVVALLLELALLLLQLSLPAPERILLRGPGRS
jgi:hypothetical protein